MKLEQLKIENFLAVEDADLGLSTVPVHLFIGDNGEGKTSVANALTAVFTGLCPERGIIRKNAMPAAIRDGAKGFNITLVTTEGTYERTHRNGSTVNFNFPLSAIDVLCYPQKVLAMNPKERQAIFGSVLRQEGTSDKIRKFLNGRGWTPNIIDKVMASMDEAQKWAIEQRRAAKRVLEDNQTVTLPPEIFAWGDKMFDLKMYTPELVGQRLQQIRNDRDTLVKNNKQGQDSDALKGVVDILQDKLKNFPSADKLHADHQDALKHYAAANTERSQCDTRLGQLSGEKGLLDKKWALLGSSTGDLCVTCGQKIDGAKRKAQMDAVAKEITALGKEIEKIKAAAGKLSAQVGALSEASVKAGQAVTNHQQEKDKIAKEIKTNEAITDDIQANQNDAKIAELDVQIQRLDDLLVASHKYAIGYKLKADRDQRIELAQYEIKLMDELDQLLKPDGELRQIANADVEGAVFDEVLQGQWGMASLQLNPDGTITLFDRPIEMASKSEQYRAGVLLAELLGRSLKAGLLILDGLEILSKENRGYLFNRLPILTNFFDTIILLMTAPADSKFPPLKWLKVWQVTDGKIMEK